jgi:16S rRNA (cytidine1402-2'-O)-methyltransferase
MPGTLFVVGTPIGNLEDLSFRALRTLKEVDLIAAEDTRRTAKLLAHYEVRRPLTSLHEHNEHRETPKLLARLVAGESIALVTDAGTPGVSDPGSSLVRVAREHGIRVVPVPGPSAVTTALAGSGFPADQFVFMGFPPRSGSARKAWMARLAEEPGTTVCFEAPHRAERTLKDIRSVTGIRPILTCRELTKIHEELVIYTSESVPEGRGEFTILVGPRQEPVRTTPADAMDPSAVAAAIECLTGRAGLDEATALRLLAGATHGDERRIRNTVKKHRISVKQQNS